MLNVMIEPLRDGGGRVCGVTSAVIDVTNARRSAEMRVELEGRAREVQKLESLGLLAGGVAHDMNNMLSVVSISAQTLKNEVERRGCSEEARRALTDIEHIAAESKGVGFGFARVLAAVCGIEGSGESLGLGDRERRTLAAGLACEHQRGSPRRGEWNNGSLGDGGRFTIAAGADEPGAQCPGRDAERR